MPREIRRAMETPDPAEQERLYKGTRLTDLHYDELITDDAVVYDREGNVLLKFVKSCLDSDRTLAAYHVLRKIRNEATNRGVAAVGSTGRPVLLDGTKSKTTRVDRRSHPEVAQMSSAIIGSMDRYARFPYCRLTAYNIGNAGAFASLRPWFQEVAGVFRAHMPERYEAQMGSVRKTEGDWVIQDTPWTTITVNRNFPTRGHIDAGDLRAGFGVMAVLDNGGYDGGYFVMPAYRIAVDARLGDVVLANVHEWHGNTPMTNRRVGYERVSCVFYYREMMHECGNAQEEYERVKNRQPGDPLYETE